MILSVVIVNYNVRHFLEQCLYSVQKAGKGIDPEVFVVDNNSADGSCQMVNEKFPRVKLIENHKNLGFSVANNQAIRQSTGKYILLLNPDTVVEEDTFLRITDFMESHPEAGALGVRMIDGKGHFLPESKRGLPTPAVAFYKLSGLSKLFPKSKIFNRYHLGYLDNEHVHEVDVLSGACMLLSRKALEKTGLLDEDYFMYGEDIDLSYRLTKNGYKNYYFPGTTIIHYKGESTRKGSLNYVVMFYNAMIIFVSKHFAGKNARLFSLFIRIAIYFRAIAAIASRFFRQALLPLLDTMVVLSGFLLVIPAWEHHKLEGGSYPDMFIYVALPSYILIWLLSVASVHGYRKPVSIPAMIKGLCIGTIIILLIYSLLSEEYRFSRALILIGFVWSVIGLTILRVLLHLTGLKIFRLNLRKKRKIIIVGNVPESLRVSKLLEHTGLKFEITGFVSPSNIAGFAENYIGEISQLKEIVLINETDEVIFCASDISSRDIIRNIHHLTGLEVDYKIAPPESISVIGSNSIDTAGDLYVIHNNSIAKETNHRKKRIFDLAASLLLLILSPVLVWWVDKSGGFIMNIFRVISGKYSWTGYCPGYSENEDLPELRPGILNPSDTRHFKEITGDLLRKLNLVYSQDYKLVNDIQIIYRGFRNTGRQVNNLKI
ncbi:MAG: glycosyltransferase [Bacteroidia bacterium]|nr:glycosyltransferase [Bacteroidia bacterium]